MYQDKPPIEEVITLESVMMDIHLPATSGNPEDISMALVNKRINMLEIL